MQSDGANVTPVPSPPSSDLDPLDISETGIGSSSSTSMSSLRRKRNETDEVLTAADKSLPSSISTENLPSTKKARTFHKEEEGPSTTILTKIKNPIDVPYCPQINTEEEKMEEMTKACRTILQCIGEDPDREGLLKTPHRWAKALLHFTSGYAKTPESVTNNAVFHEESHQEMVIVKDIDIHSLCEHHMVPFTGKVSIGYIPDGKIIGLSKLARIAEVFARRLQVQERLTSQIADAIVKATEPKGVIVTIQCSHFCMVMRGVEKCGANTVTTSARGIFNEDRMLRNEFLNAVNSSRCSIAY